MSEQKKTWRRLGPWLEKHFGTTRAFYYLHRHEPDFPKARYVGRVPFLADEDAERYLATRPLMAAPPRKSYLPEHVDRLDNPPRRGRGRPRKYPQAAAE